MTPINPLTNDEVREWITALESDKYPKGKGALREGYHGSFCCLGVLADMKCELSNEGIFRGDKDLLREAVLGTDHQDPQVYVYHYVNEPDQLVLAAVNDENTSFEPVIKKIKEIYGI